MSASIELHYTYFSKKKSLPAFVKTKKVTYKFRDQIVKKISVPCIFCCLHNHISKCLIRNGFMGRPQALMDIISRNVCFVLYLYKVTRNLHFLSGQRLPPPHTQWGPYNSSINLFTGSVVNIYFKLLISRDRYDYIKKNNC